MNDQELARQIVAHLGGDGPNNYAAYSIVIDGIAHWMPVEKFVCDWRVAGAMMEKCEAQFVEWDDLEPSHWRNMNHTANTPRAINEACDKALS